MRLTCALIFVMAGAIAPAAFGDAEAALAEANEFYGQGEFNAAADAYMEALEGGHDGATVRYNLGNALYRSDRRGAAIAHYLAAASIAPRDDDIRANLERALAERPLGPPVPPASWLHATTSHTVDRFTVSEFAIAGGLLYWLALGSVIGLLTGSRRRRTLRRIAFVSGLLALIVTGFGYARWWSHHRVERAVVAVESVQMRAGPAESFEAVQAMGEGRIVRIARDDSSWAEVIDEVDVRGWLPTNAFVRVSVGASD